MKSFTTCLLCSFVFLLAHPGCEMHPASETIPGYAEKKKEKEAKAKKKCSNRRDNRPRCPRLLSSQGGVISRGLRGPL